MAGGLNSDPARQSGLSMAKPSQPERFAYITRGAYSGHRARIERDHGSNAWLTVNENTINLPEDWFVRLAGPHSLYGFPEAVQHNPFDGAPRGISREGWK